MVDEAPTNLWQALDSFRPSEILRWDLAVGVVVGTGAAWMAVVTPSAVAGALPVVAGLVGVVIGAVVAGVAVQAAFLDQAFLRKLRLIGREPVRYLAPLLFTAVLGVGAGIAVLVLSVVISMWPTAVVATLSGITGLLAAWTLTSLIYDLNMIVQFVRLQDEAANLPDDVVELRRRDDSGGRSGEAGT